MERKKISVNKSILINAFGKYTSVIFQIVFTAILSRILSPSEFGVVAFINVFVVFFELFADLGVGTAVIQYSNLDIRTHRELYGFMCISGIILGAAFIGITKIIAIIYVDPIYYHVGLLFSCAIILTSINVVPDALIMKQKKFLTASIRNIVSCIISYGLATILAIEGWSVYALVVRYIVMILIQWGWNSLETKIMPLFVHSFSSINMIRSYSGYQLGASVLNYFQRNLDNFMVKMCLGDATLGYYDKSYTLMRYPIAYLSNVVTPVLHPILANYQDDKQYIYKQYIKILKGLSLIGIWVVGIFLVSSDEIILLMYGEQWLNAIEPLRIISYCVWPQMLTGTVGCILQSLGDTKTLFKICSFSIVISVIGISLGIRTGNLVGLSYYIVGVYWIHLLIYFAVVMRIGFRDKFIKMIKDFLPDVFSLVIMFGGARIIRVNVAINNVFNSFLIKAISVTVIFIFLALLFNRKNPCVVYVLNLLHKRDR